MERRIDILGEISDMKEYHPVKTAEYAYCQGISNEPEFNWWAPHVLNKRDPIILLVRKRNPRYLKKTHKFGIEVPTKGAEALELDKKMVILIGMMA